MFSSMKYIYEVYKEKSFSNAAKNLYISQPALSATVKRTEEQIGVPIFDRSTNPIRLTECGKKYIEAIEHILNIQDDFTNYVTDLNHLEAGTLAIGGGNLFSSYVLPPLITEFSKRFPKVHVELTEERTTQLEQQLLAGTLDLIIDNYEFDETIFARHIYQTEHLLLAVPRNFTINHSLVKYQLDAKAIKSGSYLSKDFQPVPLSSLQNEPFVFLKSENDTGERGLAICQSHGFRPNIILKLDQLMTAYNIACSGMGIVFISDTLVRCVQPNPDVVYYKIDGEGLSREVYFYRKKNKYVTRAMEEFLKVVALSSEGLLPSDIGLDDIL